MLTVISSSDNTYIASTFLWYNIYVCLFLFSNPYNDIGRYYEGNGSNVYYLNNCDSLSQSYGESVANGNRYSYMFALYIRVSLK